MKEDVSTGLIFLSTTVGNYVSLLYLNSLHILICYIGENKATGGMYKSRITTANY